MKIDEYNWTEIQKDHTNGLFLIEIIKKYNVSRETINKAVGEGLFLKFYHKYKHSEELKKKMSNDKKNFLKENPDKHVWKNNNKFDSKPCNFLKNKLKKNNISFVEEYQPFLDIDRFYSVDVAFPDEKIGIEVNGNQHYQKNGKLKKYYQTRHNFFRDKGWDLIELHYLSVYSINIEEILNFDYENKNYQFFISERKEEIERKKKNREEKKNEIQKRKKESIENKYKLDLKRIDKILNSDVDFSKFGWVQKAADLLEMKWQKISNWMKENMNDFYNNECFKRDKIRNKYNLCECDVICNECAVFNLFVMSYVMNVLCVTCL